MDLVKEETGGKPRFNTPSPVVDGAGNIFIGIAQVAGEGTAYRKNILILKLEPSGIASQIDEREVPDNGLVDGVGITQSGTQLHVFAGAHIGDPTARLYHYALPVCVPYPEGQHVGMAGAYEPTGGEPVVEIDYDRIQAMVDGAVQGIIAQFGGTSVRDGLEQKIMDGIGKAFDASLYPTNTRSRYVQDAAAPFFRDRAFEGAEAAQG